MIPWFKSSYSGGDNNCLECASAAWATSSYSNGRRGECVQVADLPATVAVRDSKHPEAGHLAFPRQEWAALLGAVRTGGF